MGMFLSNLIGSYSGTLLQQHREERDRTERGQEAEIRVLQAAAATGQLGPDELKATFERMEEITNEMAGGKGKKKSGFSFGNLIGKFSDTGGQTKAGASGGTSGGPSTQGSSGAAGTSAPPSRSGMAGAGPPPVRMPEPPARPGSTQPTTQGVNIQNPPSRFNFRNPTDIEFERETARAKAQIAAKSEAQKQEIKDITAEYVKANPSATQQEVFANVIAPLLGIQSTPQKPTSAEEKKSGLISSYMRLHPDLNYGKAEEWYDTLQVNEAEHKEEKGTPKNKINVIEGKPSSITDAAGKTWTVANIKQAPADAQEEFRAAENTWREAVKYKADQAEGAAKRTANRQAFTGTVSTFRTNLGEANRELAKAKTVLEAQEKEARATNKTITGRVLGQQPNVVAAKKAISEAQQKVDNGKRAVNYLESMRESIIDGTITEEAVSKAATELAEKGYTSVPPPAAKVTRKVPGNRGSL